VAEYELPVKYAIINNGYLGMVRQWQELFYKNNLAAVRLYQPDFVKLAEAYGLAGVRVTDRAQVAAAIDSALRHPGAVLLDFQVEEYENTFPMMPPGAALSETVDSPYRREPAPAHSSR
jgi:acetolactate synthase-1/2/3 large subunit